MPNWTKTLNIADLHKAYQAHELSVKDLAHKVADQVDRLYQTGHGQVERLYSEPNGSDLDEIIMYLRAFDDEDDIDGYDTVLKELYDWADYDHRLWVKTF